MDIIKDLKKLDRETILSNLGLQERPDVQDQLLPALGIFTAGLLVGAGMGLLMAPKTGRTMRRQLRRGATDMVEKAQDTVEELRGEKSK